MDAQINPKLINIVSDILKSTLNQIETLVELHVNFYNTNQFSSSTRDPLVEEKLIELRNTVQKNLSRDQIDMNTCLEKLEVCVTPKNSKPDLVAKLDTIVANFKANCKSGPIHPCVLAQKIQSCVARIQPAGDKSPTRSVSDKQEYVRRLDQSPTVVRTQSQVFANATGTPTRINNGVRYYRVDTNGNKIEIDGPLTP